MSSVRWACPDGTQLLLELCRLGDTSTSIISRRRVSLDGSFSVASHVKYMHGVQLGTRQIKKVVGNLICERQPGMPLR